MARSVRRRQKQRLYWVEIGFLILGIIALRPSLVTDLANMGRVPQQVPAIPQNAVGFSSYYPNWNQPAYQPNYQPQAAYQYQAAYPPQTTYQNQPVYQAMDPRFPATNYPASNVAWPNAQMHQWVHAGETQPLLASPAWSNTVPNRRY